MKVYREVKMETEDFAYINSRGYCGNGNAGNYRGVRPAFIIANL